MNDIPIHDPIDFYAGGDGPDDARQRLAVILIAAMDSPSSQGTRVAFVGDHVVIAWTDMINGHKPGLTVRDTDELIAAYSDTLRTELGVPEFNELLELL